MNKSLLTSILTTLAIVSAGAQTSQLAPRLVVSIVIDQLRTDYLEAFMPLYGQGGLKRLLNESRCYSNAGFSAAEGDRASAIAEIATGAPPRKNAIIGRYWIDRKSLQLRYCINNNSGQSSPENLLASTLSDELKIASNGRALCYAIAPWDDAAILSAGHAADGAFWLSDDRQQWTSSKYYGTSPEWLATSNAANSQKLAVWQPLNEMVGRFSYYLSAGTKKPFKHKLTQMSDYKTSGLVNADVTNVAKACIKNSLLGNDNITDFLAITYYAGFYQNSPSSNDAMMELQDTYVRLDHTLADLLETIDQQIGIGHTLFVITSTGNTPNEAESPSQFRIPTGQFYINRAAALLNMYLMAVYGQGQYVDASYGDEIYLNHKLLEDKQLNLTDVLDRCETFIAQMDGVNDVYTSIRLQQGLYTPGLSRFANAYNAQRSGDIKISVSPGWKLINEQMHQKRIVRDSNIHFPIIFFGCGLKATKIDTPVTVDRIAPTLAKAIRIRAPNATTELPLFSIY